MTVMVREVCSSPICKCEAEDEYECNCLLGPDNQHCRVCSALMVSVEEYERIAVERAV
jgi:hypothetical protein